MEGAKSGGRADRAFVLGFRAVETLDAAGAASASVVECAI
jgi:hypothetical protein